MLMKHSLLLIIFLSSFVIAMREDEKATLRRSLMQLHHSQAVHDVGKSKRTFLVWASCCGTSAIVLLCSIKKPYHLWRKVWSSIIGTMLLGLSLKTHQSYKTMKLMELRASRYKMATQDDALAQELLQKKVKMNKQCFFVYIIS